MKKTICLLSVIAAAVCSAAEGVWQSRGSAVIDPNGTNQAGNPCVTVIGSNKGGGYGGMQLNLPMDLTGATGADTIRFKAYKNISGVTVMLRGKNTQVYRTFRLPVDGQEVVLKLDKKEWKFSGKAQDFTAYDDLVIYHSALKHSWQSFSITSLSIEKGGKKLYEYNSNMTLKPRKYQVYNLGRGGHNTVDLIRSQLNRAVKLKPTLAIVMVGTNDMNNYRKLVPIDQYEKNLRKITSDLEKAGAKVILILPPPCINEVVRLRAPKAAPKELSVDPAGRLLQVCAVMRKIAAEKKYDLVDFHAIVSKNTPLDGKASFLRNPANSASNDGVHPTREGYAVLSKAIYDLIKAKGYSAEVTVCLGDSITFGSAMLGAGTSYGTSYPAQLAKLLNNEK